MQRPDSRHSTIPPTSPPRRAVHTLAVAGLLPFALGLLTAACSSGREDTPATLALPAATPRLDSMPNFRDIAGAEDTGVYRNARGRALRRGVFYRADAVTPDETDWQRLNALGIRAVYDLRTPGEIARAPDRVPDGAEYIPVNLLGIDDIDASMFTEPGIQAERVMEQAQRRMVSDPEVRKHLARLLKQMADTQGAQLFHCTAGKDRTGWVTALLHVIAGLPEGTIFEDYLISNIYTQAKMTQILQKLREHHGEAVAEALTPVMGVQESFLRAGFEQAVESYGSMDDYLIHGLGLDEQSLAALRQKLLD